MEILPRLGAVILPLLVNSLLGRFCLLSSGSCGSDDTLLLSDGGDAVHINLFLKFERERSSHPVALVDLRAHDLREPAQDGGPEDRAGDHEDDGEHPLGCC